MQTFRIKLEYIDSIGDVNIYNESMAGMSYFLISHTYISIYDFEFCLACFSQGFKLALSEFKTPKLPK